MDKLILLIEDNTDLRENIAELLTIDGYKLVTANSGVKGLGIAKELLPDLIICDIMMPGLDGYEVFSELRKNSKTKNIPFIFSTSKSENADKKKAKELGVEYYLIKPFDEAELLVCIEKCLELVPGSVNSSSPISAIALD